MRQPTHLVPHSAFTAHDGQLTRGVIITPGPLRRRRLPQIPAPFSNTAVPVLNRYEPLNGYARSHVSSSTSLQMSALPAPILPAPIATTTTRIASANGFNPSFLIGFIVGGIICSSALSIILAFGALGRENVSRAWDMTRSVLFRVWLKFTAGLAKARIALVRGEGQRWRFRRAWKVLREQLVLTRKSAVDGIEAIKLEASLYSGVVGKLGFPLAQYLVDNLSPKLGAFLTRQNLINALGNIKNKNIRRITLEDFDFGTKGPTLISARTYDLRNENAMAFDIDLVWASELEATIKVTPKLMGLNRHSSIVAVPVTLKNCRFEGVVRVVLTPLIDEPPGYGAALVSFPRAPNIGLDCTVSSVEITKTFPWLKSEILREIQKAVANEFLWPKRIALPMAVVPQPPRTILDRQTLEELRTTDPLLRAEERIDANVLTQKYEITRDVANATELIDNMNIFVGDEEERLRILNETSTNATALKKGFPFGNVKFEFPWANKNASHSNATGGSFDLKFPWQNGKLGHANSTKKAGGKETS
mmetsp:Transcript_2717/g.7974  ORF Transcript_2717/g.7974 Transcript_2717/m.7974 type:complete len:533 (+) Transcript_2717:107-1705(+)